MSRRTSRSRLASGLAALTTVVAATAVASSAHAGGAVATSESAHPATKATAPVFIPDRPNFRPRVAGPIADPGFIEDYASYEPQSTCSPVAKPGTVEVADWLVDHFGGTFGGIERACGDGTSEHKEGRAFDWTLDADDPMDQKRAHAFMDFVLKTDAQGNPHAKARRMGIMYIIWDDQIYSASRRFAPSPYLSSGCSQVATCSQTLRHRDHVHISLSRAGGEAQTSWYQRQWNLF